MLPSQINSINMKENDNGNAEKIFGYGTYASG